jgi:hypothetical protein
MGMTELAGRARIAVLVAVVVGLAIVAAVAARPAAAYTEYKHASAQSCVSCHPGGDVNVTPTNANCTASGCHTGGYTALGSDTCWTCHTPGQDISGFKTASGCAAGVAGAACHGTATKHVGATLNGGCTSCHSVTTSATNPSNSSHHVVSYTVKPALSLAVSATRITLGKTVTAKGIMHRVVTGGTVNVLVQKKNSSGVFKTLLTKRVVSTALETYSWKYKPGKKGSYRMRASVPASGKILAGKTAYKTFAVK